MEKFNFEEYRQPWETGPHWELKREFMEKYQDVFPEDRLLCLAQVYSNMELMHCSYPDEVMRQVYELSKPLTGCKRFREVKKNFPKDSPELQPQRGKRMFEKEEPNKTFKFIKFQAGGVRESNSSQSACTKNIEIKTDNVSPITTNAPNLGTSAKSQEDFDETCSESVILHISKSPDINLITKMAESIKTLNLSGKQAFEEIDAAIQMLDLEKSIKYKFTHSIMGKKSLTLCKFHIGNTLISIGRDSNERNSMKKAAEYALEILKNLPKLPTTSLLCNAEDLVKKLDKTQICFLLSIVNNLGKSTGNSNLPPPQLLQKVAESLGCTSDLIFLHFGEDLNTPLHARVFHCCLVIKKILISHGKGSCKKRAKSEAAECGVKCLKNLVNCLKDLNDCSQLESSLRKDDSYDGSETIENIVNFLQDSSTNNVQITSNTGQRKSNSQVKRDKIIEKFKDSSTGMPQTVDNQIAGAPSRPFMNSRLLHNSFSKGFALFDSSEVRSACAQTDSAVLNQSASICRRNLKTEVVEISTANQPLAFRCDVFLEGELIGTATSPSKVEAKTIAHHCTREKLQKEFYTIKVKNELLDGFVISRNQVINADVNSNAVPDSNVGCKMLKMMGWSGGSIGKSGGITEPIMAGEHRFHQGLGFENKNGGIQQFKQKIDSLLRDYSQTFTTSDLIFSNDFTKEERKEIHKIAQKYNLNTNSKGKGADRQLFIKHKWFITDLLNEILKAGGITSKYELVDNS